MGKLKIHKERSKVFTVAVLADIHGNLEALEAVLADLARERYDAMVLAGDLVTGGPQPVAWRYAQMIREARWIPHPKYR